MSRMYFDHDIQPLSECRAGVAIVLDVTEYKAMQKKYELLKEMRIADAQLNTGFGVSNDDARTQVLGRIKK